MTHSGWLCIALAIGIVACSSEPRDLDEDTGLRVTSLKPADGATDVPWATTFEATLSAALDPASIGRDAIELTLGGTVVPSVITYDAASRTLRLAAPLLPGLTYRAELKPGLRTAEGDSLSEGRVWTAATRPWAPAVVSSIGEFDFSDLTLDPLGGVHLFGFGEYHPYSDYFIPYLTYVSCPLSCENPASWGRVVLDSAFEPSYSKALEVDGTGGVYLVHAARLTEFPGHHEIRYGTCPSDCLSPGNWAVGTIRSEATTDRLENVAGFARDDGGRLHLVIQAAGLNPGLLYATCQTGCTQAANWSSALIPVGGYSFDAGKNFTVDPSGRLHLFTEYALVESYSTCPSDCLSPAQWSTTPAEWPGAHSVSMSHAVDAAGRVHLVFTEGTAFTYARCEANCVAPASWSTVPLDGGDYHGSALTVDEAGRITALNPVESSGELRFLTCVSDCLQAANWQKAVVDHPDIFGSPDMGSPRMALGPDGRPRMTYSSTARALRYLE